MGRGSTEPPKSETWGTEDLRLIQIWAARRGDVEFELDPMSKPRSLKRAGKPRKRAGEAGVRWLLIALVLAAVLIILLRAVEFSGHRIPRGPRRIAPAVLVP